jgi:hypothetical protein
MVADFYRRIAHTDPTRFARFSGEADRIVLKALSRLWAEGAPANPLVPFNKMGEGNYAPLGIEWLEPVPNHQGATSPL